MGRLLASHKNRDASRKGFKHKSGNVVYCNDASFLLNAFQKCTLQPLKSIEKQLIVLAILGAKQ